MLINIGELLQENNQLTDLNWSQRETKKNLQVKTHNLPSSVGFDLLPFESGLTVNQTFDLSICFVVGYLVNQQTHILEAHLLAKTVNLPMKRVFALEFSANCTILFTDLFSDTIFNEVVVAVC